MPTLTGISTDANVLQDLQVDVEPTLAHERTFFGRPCSWQRKARRCTAYAIPSAEAVPLLHGRAELCYPAVPLMLRPHM